LSADAGAAPSGRAQLRLLVDSRGGMTFDFLIPSKTRSVSRMLVGRCFMRRASLIVLVLSGLIPGCVAGLAADSGPVIVLPGRHGLPVIINGVDVTGAVLEGDWGLYRPHMVGPTIILPPGWFGTPSQARCQSATLSKASENPPQLFRPDGFLQVTVGPKIGDGVAVVLVSGHDHDGDSGERRIPELFPAKVPPVHPGHCQVEQYQSGLAGPLRARLRSPLQIVECLRPVRGEVDVAPLLFQERLDARSRREVVLDDQDPLTRPDGRGLLGRREPPRGNPCNREAGLKLGRPGSYFLRA